MISYDLRHTLNKLHIYDLTSEEEYCKDGPSSALCIKPHHSNLFRLWPHFCPRLALLFSSPNCWRIVRSFAGRGGVALLSSSPPPARSIRMNTGFLGRPGLGREKTSRTEFGQQMRSGDLLAYLSLNCLSNGTVS